MKQFGNPPPLSTNPPISEQFFNDPPLCPNFKNEIPPNFRGKKTMCSATSQTFSQMLSKKVKLSIIDPMLPKSMQSCLTASVKHWDQDCISH